MAIRLQWIYIKTDAHTNTPCEHRHHTVKNNTWNKYNTFMIHFDFQFCIHEHICVRQIQDTQISVHSLINKDRWLKIPHSFSFVQKHSAYATPSTHSAADFVSISLRKEKCVAYPLFPPVSMSDLSLLLIKSTI